MLIGYARVSKTEQNLDLQIDALKAAGCDPRRIFTDKQSGAKWDRRGLDAAMFHLREGDTLVVWKMDRLGRTVLQSVQCDRQRSVARLRFGRRDDHGRLDGGEADAPDLAGARRPAEISVVDRPVDAFPQIVWTKPLRGIGAPV
jgi:hypothetical protein